MLNSLRFICTKKQLQLIPCSKFIQGNRNLLNLTKFKFSSSNNKNHNENDDDHHGHHHEASEYHDFKFDRVSYNQQLTSETREK